MGKEIGNKKEWLRCLFDSVDNQDAESFVSFLTVDACFRYANSPTVCGADNILTTVRNFFDSIHSMHHHILGIWQQDKVIICEGDVTYRRSDGSEIKLPFANIFRMREDLIEDYRIYIDSSPLFQSGKV